MHEPGEETEDKFMAEIPTLPGCRAWGDTSAEALENLQSVAAAMIEVYDERGYELPVEVKTALIDLTTASDIMVLV
jgi:predicted RNase H-like HicB family nuclease